MKKADNISAAAAQVTAAGRELMTDRVFFSQTTNSVSVSMHKLVITELWLHLVQPVQHGLQSLLELT